MHFPPRCNGGWEKIRVKKIIILKLCCIFQRVAFKNRRGKRISSFRAVFSGTLNPGGVSGANKHPRERRVPAQTSDMKDKLPRKLSQGLDWTGQLQISDDINHPEKYSKIYHTVHFTLHKLNVLF